jgi:hypothetical protein
MKENINFILFVLAIGIVMYLFIIMAPFFITIGGVFWNKARILSCEMNGAEAVATTSPMYGGITYYCEVKSNPK